jgi:ribonuclease Z
MRPIFQAELINRTFGDPGVYIDLKFERRAILFDIWDISALPTRKLLRISDVFVSHTHMDHFAGFDQLLRVCLGRDTGVSLYGPPRFIAQLEHKLAAYTWNLVKNYQTDFVIIAHEIDAQGRMQHARFRSRGRFERETLPGALARQGVLLEDPLFRVRPIPLQHHDITWRMRDGSHDQTFALGELKRNVLEFVPGQRVCYVTDVAGSECNRSALAEFVRDADLLFIEAVFLDGDREHAERKAHLTARAAGAISRAAGVKSAVPFHFSPRYMGRENELRQEFAGAWRAIAAGE